LRVGSYRGHRIVFRNVQGQAVYQGDIILGKTEDIERGERTLSHHAPGRTPKGITTSDPSLLWPNGVIPFVIDSSLPGSQQQSITQAVDHWNTNTPIRFVARDTQTSYVRFTTGLSDIACSSGVGRQGGMQTINLPPGCGFGQIVHEMGHAVGLWHEQSRADRNRFLTVLYENIDKQSAFNFDQELSDGVDVGAYDFNSIMHYGAFDFSRDEMSATLETVPEGIPIGQRARLSPGDIQAVQILYGQPSAKTIIATAPSGLQVQVDGAMVSDGAVFAWAAGEQHTLEAADQGDAQTRYLFALWSDGGERAHTVTAGSGAVYTAAFTRQFQADSLVSPDGSGSVQLDPPSADGFYTDRSNVRIQATPAPGYAFQQWSVTPSRSLNPRWMTIRRVTLIAATFGQGNLTTITSTPVGRTVYVDSRAYTTPASFFWSAGETHTLDIDTSQPTFEQFRFTGWDDGGAQKHTITATGQTATITAGYVAQHSVTFDNSGGGFVTLAPSSPDSFYDEGTVINVTATPSGKDVLLGWFGDVRGIQNPTTLTVDEQILFSAEFGPASEQLPFRVASAATGDEGAVAPGEIVALYSNGATIGPAVGTGLTVENGTVTTSAGGAEVLFDGLPAPITYAGPSQINCVVPYGVDGDVTHVQIRLNGQVLFPSADVAVPVGASVPGIFTLNGTGRAGGAVLNQDNTLNTPENPAPRDSVVVLWATGEGTTSPQVADGTVNTTVFPRPLLPVSVRVGGVPAKVEYAGAAPFLVAGAMQINVRVPLGVVSSPKVPVVVVVGDQASPPGVTIAVR
jgi:astacin